MVDSYFERPVLKISHMLPVEIISQIILFHSWLARFMGIPVSHRLFEVAVRVTTLAIILLLRLQTPPLKRLSFTLIHTLPPTPPPTGLVYTTSFSDHEGAKSKIGGTHTRTTPSVSAAYQMQASTTKRHSLNIVVVLVASLNSALPCKAGSSRISTK